MRWKSSWLLPIAVVVFLVPGSPATAGLNTAATAVLTWNPDTVQSNALVAGGIIPRLYLRLTNVTSVKGFDVLVLWNPPAIAPSGYSVLGWGAPPSMNCSWISRGQPLSLTDASDSTFRIASTSDLNTTCTNSKAFYIDFTATTGTPLPAQFTIAYARILDGNAEEDEATLGPPATINFGANQPAPVILTQSTLSAWTGYQRSMKLRGYNFSEAVTAVFEKPGTIPHAAMVTRFSDRHIEIRYTFALTDTGVWNLTVANPGMRSAQTIHHAVNVRTIPASSPSAELALRQAVLEATPGSLPLTGPHSLAVSLVGAAGPVAQALELAGVQEVKCLWPEYRSHPTFVTSPSGSVLPLVDFSNYYELTFSDGVTRDNGIAALSTQPWVKEIRTVNPTEGGGLQCQTQISSCITNLVPDSDPDFGAAQPGEPSQWYLFHDDISPGTFNEDIQSTCAWTNQRARGHRGVIVGVVDSGLDANHPDIAHTYANAAWGPRILPGQNFTIEGGPEDYTDHLGHGTQVTGVMAAKTNNGTSYVDNDFRPHGTAGVAGGWGTDNIDSIGVRILPVKVIDQYNDITTPPRVADAINWAAMSGARIINLSFVADFDRDPHEVEPLLRMALENAMKMGATCVAGTGNEDDFLNRYPAKFAEFGLCIAVGASEYCGLRASPETVPEFQGSTMGSSYGSHVDLIAPGYNIYTTNRIAGDPIFGNDPYYTEVQFGTSMSCALASGVAGTLLGMEPRLRDTDLKYILRSTAVNYNGEDEEFLGSGRQDHGRAVKLDGGDRQLLTTGVHSNPTWSSSGPEFYLIIQSADGLDITSGTYLVQRYELLYEARSFPTPYVTIPAAWVRMLHTKGWTEHNGSKATHYFNYGWGEIVPGTLTATSATFRSYTYYIPSLMKWVPVDPTLATLEWAAIGEVGSRTDAAFGDSSAMSTLRVDVVGTPSVRHRPIRIEIQGAANKAVGLSVFDVTGRRLTFASATCSEQGKATMSWNGEGLSGTTAPAGVYFLLAEQDGFSARARCVLLP
jgi:hypothetical protein